MDGAGIGPPQPKASVDTCSLPKAAAIVAAVVSSVGKAMQWCSYLRNDWAGVVASNLCRVGVVVHMAAHYKECRSGSCILRSLTLELL